MPPQKGTTLWDNTAFLSDMIIGLYEAGTISKGLSPKMREGIVGYLAQCGHNVTWEGIRAGRATQRWDAHTHEDILLALFQHIDISTPDLKKVMDELKAKGYTFTESALRQHVQKLRKTKDISSIQNAGGVETPTKGTPTKGTPRKPASTKKSAAKNGRKRLPSEASDIDDDDFKKEENASDIEHSPSKKPAKRVKKEEPPEFQDNEV